MLADFQQAMADLTASPDLCNAARRDLSVLDGRYTLTALERRRLAGIVSHPGMACACIVYRANRLAPLALNLPRTCRALGPRLRDLATSYWAEHPEGNVHFFVEAERFCGWLATRALAVSGHPLPPAAEAARADEHAVIRAALRESATEAGGAGESATEANRA